MARYQYFKLCIDNTAGSKSNLKELNNLLDEGWEPVREINNGSSYYGILILLKREIKKAEVILEEVASGSLPETNQADKKTSLQ